MNIFISPTKEAEWKILLERCLNFLQNIYANIKITKIENSSMNGKRRIIILFRGKN